MHAAEINQHDKELLVNYARGDQVVVPRIGGC